MSLASYILNHNELDDIIRECLKEITVKFNLYDLKIENLKVVADLTKIEEEISKASVAIFKDADLISRIKTAIKGLTDSVMDTNIEFQKNSEYFLALINSILLGNSQIIDLIKSINGMKKNNGNTEIMGFHREVIAKAGEYTQKVVIKKDIRLTGIVFFIAHPVYFKDFFDIYVNDTIVISKMHNKNIPLERKSFKNHILLKQNDIIKIVYTSTTDFIFSFNVELELLEVT